MPIVAENPTKGKTFVHTHVQPPVVVWGTKGFGPHEAIAVEARAHNVLLWSYMMDDRS